MSAPGLHHRKPHLVSSELPGKAPTHGRRSACVVLCWPDGHWNPPSPNSSYHVKTIAPAAPPPTTTVHSTCAPSLQPPKATAPSFSLQTGRHRHYTNAFSYTCYTPPERGSAAPGRSPYNKFWFLTVFVGSTNLLIIQCPMIVHAYRSGS